MGVSALANGPDVIPVAPALDTAQFSDGDSMCALIEVANFVTDAGQTRILNVLVVNDKSDQGQPFEVFFFDRSVTLSAANAAWNVSGADMDNCLWSVTVAAVDFNDLGGNRFVPKGNLGVPLKPNGTSLFIGLRSRGTGTYAADGITLKLGMV